MINLNNNENNIQIKRLLVCTLIWFWWIILFLRRKKDFIALTPPIFRNQKIYFRKNGFFELKIRNFIDYNTLLNIFYFEEFSIKHLRRWAEIKKLAATNKLIIDCGGNIGLASVYFSKVFYDSNVICVEPSRENISLAEKNYHGDLINGAISNSDGIVYQDKKNNHNNTAFQITNEKNNYNPIKSYSINFIIEKYKNLNPFIIKIDIEGYEKFLFQDSCEWMDKFFIIIIELHDWMLPNNGNSNSFIKQLAVRDFDIIVSRENIICIRNN